MGDSPSFPAFCGDTLGTSDKLRQQPEGPKCLHRKRGPAAGSDTTKQNTQ